MAANYQATLIVINLSPSGGAMGRVGGAWWGAARIPRHTQWINRPSTGHCRSGSNIFLLFLLLVMQQYWPFWPSKISSGVFALRFPLLVCVGGGGIRLPSFMIRCPNGMRAGGAGDCVIGRWSENDSQRRSAESEAVRCLVFSATFIPMV